MPKFLRNLVIAALAIGVPVGLARLTAVRWWRVPDDDPYLEASIAPTLRGGDWVLLWRLTPPHRGDLALCPEPKVTPERPVIGRIVGIGGDNVEITGTALRINRRSADTEGRCPTDKFTTADPQNGILTEQQCDMEEVGSRVHQRGNVPPQRPSEPVTTSVPPGQAFLLSDNRLFPYDSRDFGLVQQDSCKERVMFRFVGKAGFGDVASRFTFIR